MSARTPPPDLADLSENTLLFLGTGIVTVLICVGVALLADFFGVLVP